MLFYVILWDTIKYVSIQVHDQDDKMMILVLCHLWMHPLNTGAQWQVALSLLSFLRLLSMSTVVSFSAAMSACGNGKQWIEALKLQLEFLPMAFHVGVRWSFVGIRWWWWRQPPLEVDECETMDVLWRGFGFGNDSTWYLWFWEDDRHTPIGNLGKMFYCTKILHHLDSKYNHLLSG